MASRHKIILKREKKDIDLISLPRLELYGWTDAGFIVESS